MTNNKWKNLKESARIGGRGLPGVMISLGVGILCAYGISQCGSCCSSPTSDAELQMPTMEQVKGLSAKTYAIYDTKQGRFLRGGFHGAFMEDLDCFKTGCDGVIDLVVYHNSNGAITLVSEKHKEDYEGKHNMHILTPELQESATRELKADQDFTYKLAEWEFNQLQAEKAKETHEDMHEKLK